MRPHNRKMTTRARWYLLIAATRHLLVGGFAILASDSFQSPSFGPMIAAAPLWLWGSMFVGAGIACAAGGITRLPKTARLGLMWSATSTLMVGVGLLLAVFTGDLSSPTGPIVWLAIALKDFTVCADPLRSPFEEWVEEIADAEDAADAARGSE